MSDFDRYTLLDDGWILHKDAVAESERLQAIIDKLLEVCVVCGYQAYRNSLVGNPCPAVRRYYERVTAPRPGDMVLEITNRSAPSINRVGRLISVEMEDPPPEVLSKEDYDEKEWGRPWPPYQEKIWRIQTLDSREFRWWNADFIVIPDSTETVQKWYRRLRCSEE